MSLLEIQDVSKSFGATRALNGVNLQIPAGAVHGLLGENGAGKSTLMKVLSGMVVPDAGRISVEGQPLRLGNPDESRRAGLSMAYQELSSPDNVTVAVKFGLPALPRNAFGLVSRKKMLEQAKRILDEHEVHGIDAETPIGELTLAQRQQIEITTALAQRPRLLILDEPTAALPDTEWLFRQIRLLTQRGDSAIYITHKLTEIREICDKGAVMRNGRVVAEFDSDSMDEGALIQQMIGRSLAQTFPQKASIEHTRPVLTVRSALLGRQLRGIDLEVHEGEIVGIAGLEGQGQRELFYGIAKDLPFDAGSVEISGRDADSGPTTTDFGFVPEDRKTEGLFLALSVRFNIGIPHLRRFSIGPHVLRSKEREFAEESAKRVNLSATRLKDKVADLSGGNQQKVLFARELLGSPRCLLLFDPTRGVDAATKVDIYHLTRSYAEAGGAVLIYSTEIPELIGLCDRVLTVYAGRISGEYSGAHLTEESVMHSVLGHERAS